MKGFPYSLRHRHPAVRADLTGIRGNGGLPSDCRETSVRNRRVSRGLAPTSGQQSEPAPTTGILSTCRRKCSVGFARVGLARVGVRKGAEITI